MKAAHLLLTSCLALCGPLYAATIIVNSTDDENNSSATNGNCTLREAILAANTDTPVDACAAGSGDDTIMLPAGTYVLSVPGTDEDASETGDLDVTDDLTLAGASVSNSVIDGGAIDRVMQVDPLATGIVVEILDVTIQNGRTSGFDENGAGIHNRGTLTLNNVTVSNNETTNVTVGGGLYNAGTLVLTHASVVSNRAFWAGGIGSGQVGDFGDPVPGTLTISDSIVSNNTAYGAVGSGGGILAGSGTATLRNTTVSGNTASFAGGISGFPLGRVRLSNTTVTGNTATEVGGGISNQGIIDITNSTVSGNTARIRGGGLFHRNVAIFENVTIANNQALTGEAGGVYNDGEISIEHTLLANNTAAVGGSNCTLTAGGNFSEFAPNLEDADTCGFTLTGDLTNTDPLLGPLQDNGGPTLTHALLPGSPAIDAGDPNGCKTGAVTNLTTDQRGFRRPADGDGDSNAICDIGAFEVGGPPPDIKANDSDGPVTIPAGSQLSITVALDAGDDGAPADWWVLAQTPFGLFSAVVGRGWTPGVAVTLQAPLADLGPLAVLNTSNLPPGAYVFAFAVDLTVNGGIDQPLFFDVVSVNIQ